MYAEHDGNGEAEQVERTLLERWLGFATEQLQADHGRRASAFMQCA